MHALVVDDSTTIRKILTAYLQKLGFDVTAAVNGREGLDCLKAMKKAAGRTRDLADLEDLDAAGS